MKPSPHQLSRENRGVGWAGLEPATNALKGRCSTIELPTRSEKRRMGSMRYGAGAQGRKMSFAKFAVCGTSGLRLLERQPHETVEWRFTSAL